MLAAGKVLGDKYRIENIIGKGGFGLVYRACDLRLNRIWAIKEIDFSEVDLNGSGLSAQDLVNSFLMEKEILSRLDHPSIVRITDMLQCDDSIFIVMDYIEGDPLDKVIRETGPQSQDDVVEWGIQICSALEHIHTCEPTIVYRDMKPSNVMLRPDGTVKLIDFGIAREYRPEQQRTGLSEETRVFRTQGYSAPEQNQGAFEPRSDIYSLGATLYHLLTGKSPAEPPYVVEPIRQHRPELSAGLEAVINKATQQNPAQRFASCAEMIYALENYEKSDVAHVKKLKGTRRVFVSLVAAAVVAAMLGTACLMGAAGVRAADYGYWLEMAAKSGNEQATLACYRNAAAVDPSRTEAYHGMIELYKKDAVFTIEEEDELLAAVTPNLGLLREDPSRYAALAYDIGKLYWYYFRAGAATGSATPSAPAPATPAPAPATAPSAEASLSAAPTLGRAASEAGSDTASAFSPDAGERTARVRAARRWMGDAAATESFPQAHKARIYAQIADFNCEIVAMINEGDDDSAYEPYFKTLGELCQSVAEDGNDIMRLEAAGLIEDALAAYPRKFKAAGITRQEMESLLTEAVGLVEGVETSTAKTDEMMAKVLISYDYASKAVANAFVEQLLPVTAAPGGIPAGGGLDD